MLRRALAVVTASLLLTITPCRAESTECEVGTDGTCLPESQNKAPKCSVYMAPSTLGGDTNMGIYTGVPLQKDDIVNFPEIAVPLLFREWGDHKPGYDDGQLWDRYIWEGEVMEIETYENTDREKSRAVFVPGVGCTVNSILDMNNIESTHGSIYDTTGLHRSKDPGSSAFAPYHSAQTKVSAETIPAGAELFAQYGDFWIPDIEGAQVTLEEALNQAEDFMRDRYLPWIDEHQDELSDELKKGLWEFTTQDFPITRQAMTNLPRFPWSDVEEAYQKHKPKVADYHDEFSLVRHFIRRQSIQTLDWLEEKGYCQDHLKPGTSLLPQAGRGAFANRDLPAGTVVGYAPLVHMGYYGKDVFTIEYPHDQERPPQFDLILNYSFGHKNSSILLTPYGAMVNYINHSKEKANVKIRWPDKELVAHKPDWLNKPITFLQHTVEKIGLSFEYVALRDIAEGEEVYMDYGDEWEQAWNEYVKEWKPVQDAEKYIHSTDWTEKHFRTQTELQTNPYPPNLITMCYESFTPIPGGLNEWLPILRETNLRVYCDVLDRQQSEDDRTLYTVLMKLGSGESVVVKNVDEEGIFLYDKAFSQDWHLRNSFRHEIMIPDDVMPEAWKNGPAIPFDSSS